MNKECKKVVYGKLDRNHKVQTAVKAKVDSLQATFKK